MLAIIAEAKSVASFIGNLRSAGVLGVTIRILNVSGKLVSLSTVGDQGIEVWLLAEVECHDRWLSGLAGRSQKVSRQWVLSSIYDYPGMLYGCARSTEAVSGAL